MKKILPLLVCVLLIQSCDKVEFPFYKENNGDNGESNAPVPEATKKVRKILIEDYTGHKCHNCPAAAEKLEALQQANPGRIIGVAVHAGYQAGIFQPNFTTDFQTTTGTTWFNFFGFPGTPSGMVNRKGYPQDYVILADDWTAKATSLLSLAPDAYIEITNTWDNVSRNLNTTITNEFLTSQNGAYKLCVVLTESNIVDVQLLEDNSVSSNYIFNYVLRSEVNSAWGDTIANGAMEAGSKQVKTYSITLPTNWKAENCKVVAFVYNAANYEVLQAEEKPLIP